MLSTSEEGLLQKDASTELLKTLKVVDTVQALLKQLMPRLYLTVSSGKRARTTVRAHVTPAHPHAISNNFLYTVIFTYMLQIFF
jgi:hypothetical protein